MADKKVDFVPELLAPAGSPGCALAAFDAGADAIYAGLLKFNARERGENFTPDVLGQVIDYAHDKNRKVYVTLNTLIKEKELPEIVETLALIDELSPDGVLVQDLGVLRIAREYFPNLKLHASTQMGFHNSAGLDIAAKLGVERVVLERQVTMTELAAIRKSTDLEIECFVHGALCCSLSGSCYFSSFLGGASGNRGKCKQPCRRRYFSDHGNGFFFSPQDLCGIELLSQFKKLRIESLKIEGRLRQADYVSAVVSAYRMLLDAPESEFNDRIPEARSMLSRAYGRKWSHGFYTAQSSETLIRPDAPGASGLRCGTVESIRENGFGFTAGCRIGLGDRLRLQPPSGDDGFAVTLTKIFVNNRPASRAKKGERVFVCCDKPAMPEGIVFKIGESIKDFSRRIAALPPRKKGVDLALSLTGTELKITCPNAPVPEFRRQLQLQEAVKSAVGAADIEKEFSHADSGVFRLGNCHIDITGNWFMPASELKSLRREFWGFIAEKLRPEQVFSTTAGALDKFYRDYQATERYLLPENAVETVALSYDGAEPANRRARRANSVFEVDKLSGEAILPEFCAEDKLPALQKAIANAVAMGIKRFRITSLYGFKLFADHPEAVLVTSFPLPCANSFALRELAALGAKQATAHIELEKDSIISLLEKTVIALEVYRHGRPPLLVSRAKLPVKGFFRDRRGNAFEAKYDRFTGLTRIYPRLVVSIPRVPGCADFYDLRNANWKAPETTEFNFNWNWE